MIEDIYDYTAKSILKNKQTHGKMRPILSSFSLGPGHNQHEKASVTFHVQKSDIQLAHLSATPLPR